MRRRLGVPVLAALLLAAAFLTAGADRALAQLKHNCSFCHDLHGGSSSLLQDYAVVEDLCYSCHSDAGPGQVDRDGIVVKVPKGPYAVHTGGKHSLATGCWECHNHQAEAGDNLYLILAKMPTPNSGTRPVVFRGFTGPNSFADSTGAANHVCEVCHTRTNYFRNTGLRNGHNAQGDCTTCHAHSRGFRPGRWDLP